MDKEGSILNRKNDLIAKKQADSNIFCYNLKLVKLNKCVALFCFYIDDKEYERRYTLKIYDEHLDTNIEKSFDFNIDTLVTYDSELYALTVQNDVTILSVYDLNLTNTHTYGQNSRYLPYYFPAEIKKIQVNEAYFLYLDQDEISLMNRADGLVNKRIKINSSDFQLYLDEYVLAFDGNSQRLSLYGMDGNLVNEDKLEKVPATSHLKTVLNENLIFYDSCDMSIYF